MTNLDREMVNSGKREAAAEKRPVKIALLIILEHRSEFVSKSTDGYLNVAGQSHPRRQTMTAATQSFRQGGDVVWWTTAKTALHLRRGQFHCDKRGF